MTRDHREAILGLKFSPAGANDRDLFRVASPRIRFLYVDARVSLPASFSAGLTDGPLAGSPCGSLGFPRSGSQRTYTSKSQPMPGTQTPGAASLQTPPPRREVVPRALGLANVCRLQSLRATRHIELEGLSLGESLEPLTGDGREMDEHVLALWLSDETKALRLVEPLHGATSHLKLLYPGPKTRTCRVSRRGGVRSP